MKLEKQTPKQSLNKAFLKQPVDRNDITLFKANLQILLGKINDNESEEHHKNFIRDFLKDSFYKSDYEINTKGRQDLVIHVGKDASDKVGVILEAKKPTNKADMISADNPNRKALHELILYFLRERIDENNIDVKYLIVTNINEWFIFDASVFNQLFFENKAFVRHYNEWRDKQKTTVKTDLFYNEIAKPYVESIEREIPCTYFDIRNYETALNNAELKDDESLIELFKILSPHHLLKVPFADDSNKLDKNFYTELLHIIGLEEIKDKGKLKIQRKDETRRDAGSLIENAIAIIETKDCLYKVKNLESYGKDKDEKLFGVALELCLTWINRVLFLKLLEAQLIDYHKGNRDYRFLNIATIQDFDELFTLFHQVLAKLPEERRANIQAKYSRVPYLNSSLFEISELEADTVTIESLKDTIELSFINSTVLKDTRGKQNGLPTLEYLFKFLDAYDFASEGAEVIKENNRSLINASVLGKVFEKINGYKDGSIYTPGFITMYMCRQAIRLAVVQKFKDAYGWNISEFADIKNYLADRRSKTDILEFNALINSLHLCDPAVGSGHFLVSSLNEIIAVKSELGILADASGERFRDVEITVENDELTVFDVSRNDFFKYQLTDGKPNGKEAQRLQKTLFHEKQTLIENCLFGVDINPNSVKICRLRLWIELLKNAYYKESSAFTELETLPNIDINIKEGNSLVSRFALDEDLSVVLSKVEYTIEDYQNFVLGYKETRNRDVKRDFENKIKQIKNDFRVELNHHSPERIQLAKLANELFENTSKTFLFGEDEDKKSKRLKRIEELKFDIDYQKQKIKEIEENVIYKNAFEWRFEFPEVLDDEGNFTGFDIVIGNPPYILSRETFKQNFKAHISEKFNLIHEKPNLYLLFIELSFELLKKNGECGLITPNSITGVESAYKVRESLLKSFELHSIINILGQTFKDIGVEATILMFCKSTPSEKISYLTVKESLIKEKNFNVILRSQWLENRNYLFDISSSGDEVAIINKIKSGKVLLEEIYAVKVGLQAYERGKGTPKQTEADVKTHIFDYDYKFDDKTFPYLNGSDVGRYSINWSGQWLKYGVWLSQPKSFEQFSSPRIVMREITGTFPFVLKTSFIEETFLNNKSILNILQSNKTFSLKYLLGILNSKLIGFYHIRQTVKGNRNLFPKIVIKDLKNYPIPKIEEKDQQPFVALVDQILELKKAGKDTQALEDEIDTLVYRLYDLTDDEIRIVEGKNV